VCELRNIGGRQRRPQKIDRLEGVSQPREFDDVAARGAAVLIRFEIDDEDGETARRRVGNGAGRHLQVVLRVARAQGECLRRRVQRRFHHLLRNLRDPRLAVDRGAPLAEQLQDREAVDLHPNLSQPLDALLVNQGFFSLVEENHFCTRHGRPPACSRLWHRCPS
jgi:hypothetical protein